MRDRFITAPMAGEFLHAVPGAVRIGDHIIRLTEDDHAWGPGGFSASWEVAEVHEHRMGVSNHMHRYVYTDGSFTYVNPGTEVLLFRPADR